MDRSVFLRLLGAGLVLCLVATGTKAFAADPKFAYVANSVSGNVSVYTVNQTTGALTAGTAAAAGSYPISVTVDPSGRFVYVANYYSDNVSVYTIDQTTGALTAGTAVAAGISPSSVTVAPSGRFAYVANSRSDNVMVYTIDQTSGALTASAAAATGSYPVSVTVDPSGRFAYVTNRSSSSVSVFTIDQATGALTAGTAIAAETSPESVAIDPFGRFVYAANHYSDNVSVYTVDQTTGALTDDTEVAAAISPTSVTVDPSGRFAYVTSSGYYDTFWADSKVLVYTIDQTTGALTAGTAVAAGIYPTSVTVDPSGRFAYVANYYSDNVSVYTIDQTTGALTAGTAVAAGTSPASVAVTAGLTGAPNMVVEFYHAALDHYFLTADPAEMVGIDNGAAGPGWARTGLGFDAYTLGSGVGEKAAVCRFYGDARLDADGARIGPNSHFYTANAFECESVKTSPGWMYETLAFAVSLPIEGICERGGGAPTILTPDTLRPVYRAYNNRYMFNDSNHRYTTDIAVYQAMISQGWVGEGVVFCVP